jgi:preprotein translocase subunit SecE
MMADDRKTAVSEAGADAPARRSFNPVRFWNEVIREMKKVTWPSIRETYLTTILVFIMVALTMVFFFAVDSVLSYAEQFLVGARRLF